MMFPSTKSLNGKIRLECTRKEWVVMGTEVVGVLHVELLASKF